MKKDVKISFIIAFFFVALGIAFISNPQLSSTDISLSELASLNVADAQEAQDCPGGSCTYTSNAGDECSACCPAGKDPVCDAFSCRCESN